MTIKEDIVYNKFTGELVGFVNLENYDQARLIKENNTLCEVPVVTKMFSLFVRAPTSSFKYAYAHFPSHNLNERQINSIMWKTVANLDNAGFKVLGIIGDGAPRNREFFKMNTYDAS